MDTNHPAPFGAIQDMPGQPLTLGARRHIHPATIAALTNDKEAASLCDERYDPVAALRRRPEPTEHRVPAWEIAIMALVVALIGAMLACGSVL